MIITWSIVRSEEKNYHRMIKLFLFFSRVRVNLRCCTFVFHFVRFARNYFVFFKIRIKGKRNGSLIPDVKEKRQRRRFDSKHQYKFQKWFTINWSQFTKSWSIYTSVHCLSISGCLVCMCVESFAQTKIEVQIRENPTSSSSSSNNSTQMNCVSNFNFVAKWLNEWSHWITNWPDQNINHRTIHLLLLGFFLYCVCFSFTIFGAAAVLVVVKILLLFATLNRCFF